MEQKSKKRILFLGIPDMAYIGLDCLLNANTNIVGVLGPKKSHEMYYPFKNFVLQRGLNFIEFEELYEDTLIKTIKNLNIDLAVVCSYNYKIPKILLNSVKDGFVNVHPSLLPLYRGGNPYSRVIYNNETETGVTIHFMDENFDTGDIICQIKQPLQEYETMGTLFNRLNLLGAEMLVAVLKKYETEPLPRTPQPQGKFISGNGFSQTETLINFNKPAKEIERLIRALNPFIFATTLFRENIVRVMKAEYTEEEKPAEFPLGSIVKIENNNIYISTQKGLLIPKVLQFGSFFTGDSEDFIKILNPRIGECFFNG